MNNLMQRGRSMVEMLGVLAIVGLLSIVGIAGYKKAMLQHYTNEAWDSMMKFQAIAKERAVLYPKESCASWYCSALYKAPGAPSSSTAAGYCYFDLKNLLPSFANGSYENYYNFISTAGTTAQWRNIPINGLCSALIPDYKVVGSSASSQYLESKTPVNGITYRCYRKNVNVEW